ncbi:MAG: ATP-grasp domain-containing protein [Acidimicrobiia bacterium]|nr:ATP-grasp domain-containing protein [Acidimicrobiia bacterium]MDH3463172.1 ATP-grasp domain-containing protein [Acidimicrobiia bacterium]
MSRVVVILPTQSYRAGDFVRAAEELGIELIVASEGEAPIDMGDRYVQIDCADPAAAAETIVALGDNTPIDGVVAADDAGVVVAALVGTRLGLPANGPEAALATRDKLRQRTLLHNSEVPQPRFAGVGPGTDIRAAAADIGYPLVVKPLGRSAGQGVIRVDRPDDLEPSVERVRNILDGVSAPNELLVESYLAGDEVAVEGILGPDGLVPLTIFDKPGPMVGPGFQETILITPSRHPAEVQEECLRVAAAATRALGLTHGPVHVELMVTATNVAVIEIAARSIGGLCSRSLSFGLMDTTLEALILRNALGRDKPELRRDRDASGVLMIPIPKPGTLAGVEGTTAVRAIEGITGIDITAKVGDYLAPPPEGARYLGFVFARGETADEVEAGLRKAMATLEVVIR